MNCCKLAMKVWAAAFAVAVGAALPLGADVTLTENMTLDADADWREQGTVTISEGVTLDLGGHTLRVAAIAGAGRVADSKSYEILDYIEANGAQRIVTDYVPGTDTKVEVVAEPTVLPSSGALFGTKSWSTYRFLCGCVNNIWYFWGNSTKVATSINLTTRYRFVASQGTGTLFNDATGAQLGTQSINMANNDNSELAICGITGHDSRGNFKVYSFKVWHGDDMRFDFVPARNLATGEVGLLNRLDGTLHTSDESPFIAGPAVADLLISATSEAALADFSGTVDSTVVMALDGKCTLAADADWRRFPTLRIDGTVDLAGHDLSLSDLRGNGVVTDLGDNFLEYVESTAKQIVNTGVIASTDTAVELDATYLTSGNGTALFGCDAWSARRYMFVFTSNNFYFFGAGKNFGAPANGTRYIVSVTPSASPNGKIKVVNKASGALLGSEQTDTLASNDTELRLFGFGDNTRMGNWRLHSFKMWKGGDLKRDLVPMRKNNRAGLYDRVSGDFFVSATAEDLVAGPVAAGAANLGSLHVDIAEGRTVVADSLELGGSLRLVKEGGGTLTMNRAGQTYMGGTLVAAGVIDTKMSGAQNQFGATDAYFGKLGSSITIEAGGVFDFKGNSNYRYYDIVLNGGTLRNGGYDQAQNQGSLGSLTLTADSSLETVFNTTVFHAMTDVWNLGAHTLFVDTMGKTLYFRDPVNVTNGVFWVKGDGCWQINSAVNARGATLRAESALWLGAKLDVDDYYAACTNNVNNGTAAMNVYGRFTPATDYFYGCTMQHGSVLDLNGRSGAWSTASAFTAGSNRVTFAPGATVTVDVHARRPWSGKVVDWGEGNAPEGVAFRLDEESKAMGRALSVRADGLYAVSGILMIVR